MKKQITLEFDEIASLDDLDDGRRALVASAMDACTLAYAPYSKFQVGASVELEGGAILHGSNKENASFPAGTCAERNVLNYVSDQFPGKRVVRLAISATSESFEMSGVLAPCGICRQVICEVERAQGSAIEILLHAPNGTILKVASGKDLLPFHFYVPQLKK